ncbi:hypothetical protein FA95DRAFT_1307168 [Auriscalpium vulgare]|uniref:Uncharacterized protein n=1 Tax=Auriscalpium vulgare TaxID=40419 RepID=A0ACB8RRT0_9AGAM|nr:hypothetical protein FA95DRAFT_1307168 [Auriscalpium vulgare]
MKMIRNEVTVISMVSILAGVLAPWYKGIDPRHPRLQASFPLDKIVARDQVRVSSSHHSPAVPLLIESPSNPYRTERLSSSTIDGSILPFAA